MIAALYVQTNGVYYGLPDVDPWDKARDARAYAGPHPVVAHPPCERWGRYWYGGPTSKVRYKRGDDGGCFAAALAAVRRWGGVLEHPEGSYAWRHFQLNIPPKCGAWIPADHLEGFSGWTCCVEQGWYGHRARKATWLYVHGARRPALKWGKAPGRFLKIDHGFHSSEERRAFRERNREQPGILQMLSHRERAATPEPFRDLLLDIARSARS